MLPSSFDLSITEAPTESRVYEAYDRLLNGCVLQEAGHEFSARDFLILKRTQPKPAGNFYGVKRTMAKFTKDYTVLGKDGSDIVSPLIISVETHIPVGIVDADERIVRLTLVNWLLNSNIQDFHQHLELP